MVLKPEQYFWLRDGRSLKDLKELSEALINMPKDVFDHHVTKDRNDFANWVKGVLKAERLSEEIKIAKNPRWMKAKVDAFLYPVKKAEEKPKVEVKEKPAVKPLFKKPALKEKTHKKVVRKEITETTRPKMEVKDDVPKVKPKGKVWNFFFEEDLRKEKELMAHNNSTFAINCPAKSFKCGFMEFVFGIIVGLALAAIIYKLI
jgi:hypothetical protein